MLLTKLKVRNFLSVNGDCELPIDERVTVLLGANDHGKSNLLRALEHLNADAPIRGDEENWDSKGPRLDFTFKLTDDDLKRISTLRDLFATEEAEILEKMKPEEKSEGEHEGDDAEGEDDSEGQRTYVSAAPGRFATPPLPSPRLGVRDGKVRSAQKAQELDEKYLRSIQAELKMFTSMIASKSITLTRDGVDADLSVSGWTLEQLEAETQELLKGIMPRVELFKAFSGELQDSVTSGQIKDQDAEFLQGIFFYAGLDPLNCSDLFNQTDETDKTLEDASVELDRELRRLWGQGVDLDLHFQLKHKDDSIELYAKDPAVKRRHARMSKRSAGVTQFFRLSMVLHARRKKNPANSYIYLFDEPGVFLHPKGQKDLLAVFEQLANETQIIYATHSLFMLNQNYPERHRLIAKDKVTTLVDSKPYRANWKYAVDALGVRLTANILFSPNVLLVEGDSDPLYIYDLFRVLNHIGEIDADANLIGIMSYSDLPNLRFLLQTFKAESKERVVTVLFEGDAQGRDYQKAVANLCRANDIRGFVLEAGNAIEDYCLYPALFLSAVAATLKSSFEAIEKKPPADLVAKVEASWQEFVQGRARPTLAKPKKTTENKDAAVDAANQAADANPPEGRVEQNAGKWFKGFSEELVGPGGASKVALARNYVFLSRDNPARDGLDAAKVRQGKIFLEPIIGCLKLPSMKAKPRIES